MFWCWSCRYLSASEVLPWNSWMQLPGSLKDPCEPGLVAPALASSSGICFVLWTIPTFVMEGAQQWPIGLLPSSSLQFLFFGLSPLIIHRSPSLEVLGIIQEAESQEDSTTKQNVKDKNLTRFGSFCGGASLIMQLWWGCA